MSWKVKIPRIGEIITVEWALVLCFYYGLIAEGKRIEENPDRYKDWRFDGATMLPDYLFRKLFKITNLIEIALKHDLAYGFGVIGDEDRRKKADRMFRDELIRDGARVLLAEIMYGAVRVFGRRHYGPSFKWGFAKRESGE